MHMLNSFASDSRRFKHSMRMFHMSSVSGVFEATEILNPCRSDEAAPFSVTQHELLRVPQPGKK